MIDPRAPAPSGLAFAHGARDRLTMHDLGRFAGTTLFDRLGRVVCGVGKLPRKELYEAWEVARRVRRWHRGGRIVDVAGGHGLLAHAMLLLDDSSPEALVVDPKVPRSATALHDAIVSEWPRLKGVCGCLQRHPRIPADVHRCVGLEPRVRCADRRRPRRRGVSPRDSRGAPLLPRPRSQVVKLYAGALAGWLDGAMAIDVLRATRLEAKGYRVRTQTIPPDITPKNRLLVGAPAP